MPAKSRSQQRLMQAAEHGATFPMAEKIRSSMTHDQMHDFAVGSEKGKPEHVKKARMSKPAADPNHESYAYDWRAQQHPHRNLGKFLHKAK